MRLYIARHGQTAWNSQKRWQGNQDVPMDETGVAQAHLLAKRLRQYSIDKVYSSPLSRAALTARIIQDATGWEVTFSEGLKEVRLGDWECHTTAEVNEKQAELFAKWESDPAAEIGFGVENLFSLQNRALAFLREVSGGAERSVLLVAHGTWVRALMCGLLEAPLRMRTGFEIDNCGLNLVDYDETKGTFTVVSLNDISHLQCG